MARPSWRWTGEKLVGFSYIECWGHGDFVATSGLIVDPEYRHMGLAEQIKRRTFELARRRFPYAKLFSITTSLPVMKLNSRMGYVPVTFSELTEDEEFWQGCQGCCNYDILQRNHRRMCLCTGMLYDPAKEPPRKQSRLAPYKMFFRNKVAYGNNVQHTISIGGAYRFLPDRFCIQHIGNANHLVRKSRQGALQHFFACMRHNRKRIHFLAHVGVCRLVNIELAVMPPCDFSFCLNGICCQIRADTGAKSDNAIIMVFSQQNPCRRLQGTLPDPFS